LLLRIGYGTILPEWRPALAGLRIDSSGIIKTPALFQAGFLFALQSAQ